MVVDDARQGKRSNLFSGPSNAPLGFVTGPCSVIVSVSLVGWGGVGIGLVEVGLGLVGRILGSMFRASATGGPDALAKQAMVARGRVERPARSLAAQGNPHMPYLHFMQICLLPGRRCAEDGWCAGRLVRRATTGLGSGFITGPETAEGAWRAESSAPTTSPRSTSAAWQPGRRPSPRCSSECSAVRMTDRTRPGMTWADERPSVT
jgi:hypothetical protein